MRNRLFSAQLAALDLPPDTTYKVLHESFPVPMRAIIIQFIYPRAKLVFTTCAKSQAKCANPLCHGLNFKGEARVGLYGYCHKPIAKWCLKCAASPDFITLVIAKLPRYKGKIAKNKKENNLRKFQNGSV